MMQSMVIWWKYCNCPSIFVLYRLMIKYLMVALVLMTLEVWRAKVGPERNTWWSRILMQCTWMKCNPNIITFERESEAHAIYWSNEAWEIIILRLICGAGWIDEGTPNTDLADQWNCAHDFIWTIKLIFDNFVLIHLMMLILIFVNVYSTNLSNQWQPNGKKYWASLSTKD